MGDSFPPIDYPVYGLGDSWDGPRWLDHLQGMVGKPSWGVCLGHGQRVEATPTEPWALVISLASARHALTMGGDATREVAFAATFALVNLTLPAPRDRAEGFVPALIERAEREADRYAEWPACAWSVDGGAVSARTWHWAGAWAGFTTDLDDTDLIVVGHGMEPGDLALSLVPTGAAYHMDWGQPVAYPEDIEASQRAALAAFPDPPEAWWPVHADHANP